MAVVGEAFINLKSGSADAFTRDANGRLRDAKGKFVKSGEASGEAFASGFSKETGSKLTSSAKGLAKRIALVLGGAYAIRSGVAVVEKSLAAADESRKIGAQTEAVIKSTGDAANVTAAQIDKMATAMSLKTGIDDEAIQQGQNLLLTFTNIRNEAGKGNDIFTQSSKTLLDLATAMGTDPKSAAIQLGKALNDPTKGITALSRVGVNFTDQQKKQIAALQSSGDMMGAQKIILAELNKEFGGSAEAQASAIDKIKVAFGNLQETFGGAILPAIEKLLPTISTVLESITPLLETLGGTIGQALAGLAPSIASIAQVAGPIVGQIGEAIQQLLPAVQPVVEAVLSIASAFTPLLPVAAYVFGTIARLLAPILTVFGKELRPVIEQVAAVMVGMVQAVAPMWDELGGVIVSLLKAFGPILASLVSSFRPLVPVIGTVVRALGGALGKVLLAIAPVIASLAKVLGGVLAKTLKALAPAFVSIAGAVRAAAPSLGALGKALVRIIEALSPVLPMIGKLVASLVKALAPVLPVIADALANVAKAIEPLIPVVVQIAEAMGKQMGEEIKVLAPALMKLVEALGELLVALLPILEPLLKLALLFLEKISVPMMVNLATALGWVAEKLATLITWVAGLVDALVKLDWSSLGDKARGVVDAVVGFFSGLPGRIARAAGNVFGAIIDKAKALPGEVASWIGQLPGRILDLQKDMGSAAITLGGKIIDGLATGLSKGTEFVGNIAKSIKHALVGLINDLVGLLNAGIPNKLPWGPLSINLPDNPIPKLKLAQGAIVQPRAGGVLANIAEAGWPEVVMSTNPAMADRNRMLLRRSGLDAQLAATPTNIGPSFSVGQVKIETPRDGRRHAIEFIDGLRSEMWLAGAAS